MNKIEKLENEIRYHDKKYWIDNNSKITDPEYDQLVNKLSDLDPDNKYLNRPKAPRVDSQGKVHHSIKMLSLDKAYSYEEIVKWCEKVSRSETEMFRIMPKFDGVSGQLIRGILATRGDGEIGENITNKLVYMDIIKKNETDENVRGEIVFTKSKFKEVKNTITRKSGEPYKNERNAVGGILNRDDLKPVKILTFIDFESIYKDLTLHALKELGEDHWKFLITTIKDLNFPTDGIVVRVLDKKYAKSLGSTRHHLKSATAFKFENPFGWSEVVDIVLQPGKHGLTPVVKIKPLIINGVKITSVTGHNWRRVLDYDIRKGDMVKVERAGDVIPYITEVKLGSDRIKISIDKCPICNSDTIFIDPQLECSNINCEGKLLNRLYDSVIRIGIDRLGRPTIQKMIDVLNIENLVDIFSLTEDDIYKLPGFAKTSTKNLLYEISKVKENGVYEWQILASLNIPGIGQSLSKDLLCDRSLSKLTIMNKKDLEILPSIGPERAQYIHNGIYNNSEYLKEILRVLPIKENKVIPKNLTKICFTGKFPERKSFYYNLLEKKGGYEILEKVKDIDVLVVADPSKQSNKMKTAQKKGVKIIGINELAEELN